MPFSSLEFALFFLLVLSASTILRANTMRKFMLLGASCYFYAYWDYRFLGLLLAGTLADFAMGLCMQRGHTALRRMALSFSLVMNIGLLAIFKYHGFFLEELIPIFKALGLHPGSLNLLLPLGISFYTFLRLSYTIDVYRGTIQAERNLLDFTLYCCFFPHVLAGPLTRPKQLLTQFKALPPLTRENLESGFRLFCFGLFKKVVLADRLALYVDAIFTNAAAFDSPTVWLATLAYSMGIYLDFSGYTDMARGIARCLGYELAPNFDFPYLSRSPSEFWRRWHISLSYWFRDYLYIPLGGSRCGLARTCTNMMLTMLLCGLWHGAGWTFIFWGGWHGLGLVIHRIKRTLGRPSDKSSRIGDIAALSGTLLFVHIGWVFFRAENFKQATVLLERMFLGGGTLTWINPFVPVCLVAMGIIHLLKSRQGETWTIFPVGAWYTPFGLLTTLGLSIVFATTGFTPFIYAQF